MRVVSLVPSITETLLAWGITPVAVTRFCEQPALATIGGTKDPDVGAIVALAPDLVVLDEEENRRPDYDALVGAGLRVHATAVRSVVDVAPTLRALADVCGLRVHVDTPVTPAVAPALTRTTAFVAIWRRPWMTINADTYGASVLAALDVDSIFADALERYPTVTLDEVASRRPSMVILPSEPYPFAARHVDEVASLAPAVHLVDGRDLFWWGVRTPAALTRLGQALRAA